VVQVAQRTRRLGIDAVPRVAAQERALVAVQDPAQLPLFINDGE
jgi:hypothetical protein